MSVYLCLLIPIFTIAVLMIGFKKHVVWWELIVPCVISVIFILISKHICIVSLTSDVEYLGGYVTEVRYYEDWNERVSCRHPRYCTRCSGSGKTRSCSTYICGYYHAYDVDYHPEHWTAETTLGTYDITQQRYDQLLNQFKVSPVFKDLHRSYHTNDGDMYHGDWKGEDETLEPVTATETYENRPKACTNVFHFELPDTTEIKMYGLHDYPVIHSTFHQDQIIGYTDKQAEKKLQVLNARLGKPKQLRVYIVVFRDQPREAAFVQERMWEGGNKNEFVVCVGIDSNNKVQWSEEFSWTERTETKVDVRTFIESQDQLNLSEVVDFMYKELSDKWQRRNFADFDYLTIYPTMKQTVWIFVLTFLLNVGVGVWVVKNEIETN